MRSLSIHLPAAFAAALLVLQLSCSKSAVGPIAPEDPIPEPPRGLIFDGSFEHDGQPTLDGWRITNASVTTLVPEPAPGGGEWSLGLEADWAPTTGYVTMPIPGIRDGEVLRLSAFVRAVDQDGGGSITLSVGPSYGLQRNRAKCTSTSSTSWTYLSVQDTVSLGPGDTVWVALSSPNTEITRRQGRFDLVSLRRIQNQR